jgi:hypothetical protein
MAPQRRKNFYDNTSSDIEKALTPDTQKEILFERIGIAIAIPILVFTGIDAVVIMKII